MPTPQPTTTPNTRAASKAAFTHITTVLLYNANITKAFKEDGIENVAKILSLTDKEVDDLTYLDSNPSIATAYSLNKGEKGLIKSFIHFVHHWKEISNPIGDDCANASVDEFEQFRANLDYTRRFGTLSNLPSIGLVSSNSTSTTSTSTPIPSPVTCTIIFNTISSRELSKRGIKRDPAVYPTLKDELWNDNWHRSFANQL
jgi:hypothetical protein